MAADNKAIVRRYFEEAVNNENLDEKIAEAWVAWGTRGLLRQLGAAPTDDEA